VVFQFGFFGTLGISGNSPRFVAGLLKFQFGTEFAYFDALNEKTYSGSLLV